MTAAAPWVAVRLDPEMVVAELRRRFPGVCPWFGEYTGSWWAMFRDRYGRDRLIEARTPAELARRLEEVRRVNAVPRYSRPPSMTGVVTRTSQVPPSRARRVPVSSFQAPRHHQAPRRRSLMRRLLATFRP